MKRFRNRKVRSFKSESVEDPHELLLSLVDLGSLDAEEALLACVREMSDAECKRVLSSLSLPLGTEEVEDDLVQLDDEIIDDSEDDFAVEDEVTDEEPVEDEAEDTEECVNRRLEAKISKLERLTFGNRRFRR